MKSESIFTVAIMDTNAFDKKHNDFCGSFDSIIPSFFRKLSDKKIRVVTHPVLIGETKKHIRNGLDNMPSANKKIEDAISALKKHKDALSLTSFDYDTVMEELKQIDLVGAIVQEFEKLFRNAEILPYGDPATVFNKYFNSKPPFTENGKISTNFLMLLLLTRYLIISSCIRRIVFSLYQMMVIGKNPLLIIQE